MLRHQLNIPYLLAILFILGLSSILGLAIHQSPLSPYLEYGGRVYLCMANSDLEEEEKEEKKKLYSK